MNERNDIPDALLEVVGYFAAAHLASACMAALRWPERHDTGLLPASVSKEQVDELGQQ